MKILLKKGVLGHFFFVLLVPGALAAPFADRTALKAAVDSCLAVDATGVACCNHGADCGAAGTTEMADWDVSLVMDMSWLFYYKLSFNADISRWDTSSVTNMVETFRGTGQFNAGISRWDVSSVTNMGGMFMAASNFNADISRWDTSSVTNMNYMFTSAAWHSRFHNCGYDSSHQVCSEVASYASSSGSNSGPPAAWVRKNNACDASTPPYNGGIGNCTDTLVSSTSCVPTCDPGYTLEGATSCTDRVLTEAGCTLGIPCNPPAVSMHAGEVVGGLGECDGIEKIPHLSTCSITCNTAEGYYVEGPAMCNQGTLIGGVKCLCTKGHPRSWRGTLACQKRMRGIHVPGTFHDEL